MNTQRHLIKRQVIELTLPSAAQAQPLQDEISRIYRQRLIPLIDQCLTEVSDADTLYRLESLELDIGALDSQHLEEELVEKVRHVLRRELGTHISRQEHTPGSSPGTNSELDAHISRQDHTPGSSPGTNSQVELFALFVRTGTLPWWADTANPHLLAENLNYLLHHSSKVLGPLLRDLARASQPRQRLVNQYTDEQLAQLAGVLLPTYKLSLASTYQALLRILQNSGTASTWPYFHLRRSLWNNLLQVASLGGQEYVTLPDLYQAVFKRMASELGNPSQTLLAELQQVTATDNVDVAVPIDTSVEQGETRLDARFAAADEVYIANAGLVILWPFLENFFARVNLLEARQFKDSAAQQRAVGLLQYVATEDPSPPEYLLPLNKVLCGMELDEVFEVALPITESEAEECINLLTAVIANAPILKNMSLNGLRGTFLLRQGVLSIRDGAWLLRVERETYDVVLDRFPWTMQWVKLPWMDTALRVEW